MTKILMVGDSHGDTDFMIAMINLAHASSVDKIIQLGDFGFIWPGSENRLDSINNVAASSDVDIIFLPGNHEDWDTLDSYENLSEIHKSWTPDGFVKIMSNVFYTGKVHQWVWDENVFTVAGGAYSIDKQWRTPGVSWWPQEELTDSEVHALRNLPRETDILLTHDSPTWAPHEYLVDDLDSHMHRQKIDAVSSSMNPVVWFHGHYHHYMEYKSYRGTNVYGLDCNGGNGSYAFLDTDTFAVTVGN